MNEKRIRKIAISIALFSLPSIAFCADQKIIIVTPDGRLQYYPRFSSNSIGDFLDVSTASAQDGKALIWGATEFRPAFVSTITQAITINDEGLFQGKVSSINCVGSAIACSALNDLLTMTITASGGGGGVALFVEPAN